MSTGWIVLIVVLVILIGVLVGLYFFGKKAEKKQAAQQEQMDAMAQTVNMLIKNKIKISGTDSLEIMKSGLSNTHMIFEKNKKNLTYYKTLYGQMLVGLNTRNMEIEVSDETIKVRVDYELDVNHEPLANCKIRMNIVSKGSGIAV